MSVFQFIDILKIIKSAIISFIISYSLFLIYVSNIFYIIYLPYTNLLFSNLLYDKLISIKWYNLNNRG